VDRFLSHYGLVVVGILECILVGWLFRTELIRNHINKVSDLKIGFWWDFIIKFFIPVVLTLILISDLINELKKPYGDYGWNAILSIGVNWLFITLLIALVLTWLPWRENSQKA
jgi:NSS family neurotransmitter:Na+ symporter